MLRQMRGISYVPFAVSLIACAPTPSGAPIAAPTAATDTQPPVQSGQPPAVCGAWVVHATRHEKTTTVASCQVAPIELASDLTAEIHRVSPTRLAVRIVQDRESGDNLPPSPGLAGKSYDVETGSELAVRGANGPLDDEETRRVRALAAAVLPLPSRAGDALGHAVEAVVDMHLRGTPAREVATSVRPGNAPSFAVRIDASESDAGMCHTWSTTAHLAGDLSLRGDGTIDSLRLRGPVTTTEALCPEGARQAGASAEPRECTRGEITFRVDPACAPSQ
jgi:hypothetical protein